LLIFYGVNLAENMQLYAIIEIIFIYKTILYCAYNKHFTCVFFLNHKFFVIFLTKYIGVFGKFFVLKM